MDFIILSKSLKSTQGRDFILPSSYASFNFANRPLLAVAKLQTKVKVQRRKASSASTPLKHALARRPARIVQFLIVYSALFYIYTTRIEAQIYTTRVLK